MAVTAYDEAKTFLFRHPWATTEVDNPVRLLEDLIAQIECGGADTGIHPDDDGVDDGSSLDRAANLLSFIKDLREQEKISEAEYQIACAIE